MKCQLNLNGLSSFFALRFIVQIITEMNCSNRKQIPSLVVIVLGNVDFLMPFLTAGVLL